MVLIEVDGQSMEVPEGTSIKQALEALGFQIIMFPSDPGLFMPCQTGGCWTCTLDIDGELGPACVSALQHGMRMKTDTCSLTHMHLVGGCKPGQSSSPITPAFATSSWPAFLMVKMDN